jgi:hypothetical protein
MMLLTSCFTRRKDGCGPYKGDESWATITEMKSTSRGYLYTVETEDSCWQIRKTYRMKVGSKIPTSSL